MPIRRSPRASSARLTAALGALAALCAAWPAPASALAPQVFDSPVSEQVPAGDNAVFHALSDTFTGQWQVSTDGGATWSNDVTDTATTDGSGFYTLTIPAISAAQSGNQYRIVLTGTGGSSTSAAATLTVLPAAAPVVTGVSPTSADAALLPALVTITGLHFTGAKAVTFLSVAQPPGTPRSAAFFVALSSTKILALTPTLPHGGYYVQVKTAVATSPPTWPPGGPVNESSVNLFSSLPLFIGLF